MSKADLFAAVVKHRVELRLGEIEKFTSKFDNLEEALIYVGCEFYRLSLTDESVSFDRMVTAQAKNFPELGRAFHKFGFMRAQKLLAQILSATWPECKAKTFDINFLAEHFLYAIVSAPLRRAVLQVEEPRQGRQLQAYVRNLVKLFTQGCLAEDDPRT